MRNMSLEHFKVPFVVLCSQVLRPDCGLGSVRFPESDTTKNIIIHPKTVYWIFPSP